MIQEIENTIVTRLAAPLLAMGVKVLPLPDAGELPRPTQSGQAFVAYTGSKFSKPTDFNGGQERVARIEIILQVKGLRTHQGGYALIDKIHELLTRFSPIGDGVLFPESDRFLGVDSGIWSHSLSYTCSEQHF